MVMQFSTGQTLTQRLQPTHSLVDHLEIALAVLGRGDRLVRGVLADDVAAAAVDAEVLVDARLGDVVEIEVLPVADIGHGAADEIAERRSFSSR